jgi:S1-C subfamily serine protease
MFFKKLFNTVILILSVTLLSCNSNQPNLTVGDYNAEAVKEVFSESGIENITISPQSIIDRRVRNAAVKITNRNRTGHGSGSYFSYRGFHLVITAYHVVDEIDPDKIVIIGRDNESVEAKLIYSNRQYDIAVLQPRAIMTSRTAIPLNILQEEPEVNSTLIYTGFPSGHDLLTFQGNIAGFDMIDARNRKAMLVHTYGWFGSSGSCLFNQWGRLVGILWGVDVEVFAVPQAQEDIIYASAASEIDLDAVLEAACHSRRDRPLCQRLERENIRERFDN